MRFRKRERREHMAENHRRIPLFCFILMIIGSLTILYLMIVYVLMPVLAMLTVS